MYNHLLYIAFWAINTLILILGSAFAGEYVRLGNSRFTNIEAGVYAGFWITFIVWAFWDFSMGRRYNLQKKYRSFIFFFLVNIFAFWAASKFEHWIGYKLLDFSWVFVLSFIATFSQRIIKKAMTKRSLNSAWF